MEDAISHAAHQAGLARRGVRPARLEQPVRGIAAHPVAHDRHHRRQRAQVPSAASEKPRACSR